MELRSSQTVVSDMADATKLPLHNASIAKVAIAVGSGAIAKISADIQPLPPNKVVKGYIKHDNTSTKTKIALAPPVRVRLGGSSLMAKYKSIIAMATKRGTT